MKHRYSQKGAPPPLPTDMSGLGLALAIGVPTVIAFILLIVVSTRPAAPKALIDREPTFYANAWENPKPGTNEEYIPNARQKYGHLTGGTLHRATMQQWHRATRQNQVATCADMIASKFPRIGLEEIERRAEQLATDVSFVVRAGEPGAATMKVSEIAAAILILNEHGWK